MIYHKLIMELREAGKLYESVQTIPGGGRKACFVYRKAHDAPEKFRELARLYPDHRDELLHIAAATVGSGYLALLVAGNVYPGKHFHELFEPLARAYIRAPKDLAEYQMSVPKFTRNMITAMHYALGGRSGTPSLLEQLVKNPPEAVRSHDYYRLLHILFTGMLAHRYHPDPRYIHAMADAIDGWKHSINDDDVTELLSLAPKDTALLPLVSHLVERSPESWIQPTAGFYLAAFARTPDAWDATGTEIGWTKANLHAAVREPLNELFKQREFTDDAVDAVFQSLVERMGDEAISAWFVEVLNSPYYSSDLSRNLMRGLAVRVPEKAKHYVQLAMQSVSNNPDGWKKIADWIAGENSDDDRKVVDLIPQNVRRAAQSALAEHLDEFLGRRELWMGHVARRLLTAALGIRSETARALSRDDAIRYWQQVRLFFTDPQRLLSDEQITPVNPILMHLTGAQPLTMRDMWRDFDTARRAAFEKLLCQGG